MERIRMRAIQVEQPIGSFFVGSIDSRDVVAISYADIRRPEGRELERYIGTQRDLSPGRVEELKRYVTNIDACFPTSVILAVASEDASYDEETGVLELNRHEKVAKIIDGQHRIAGLSDYSSAGRFELNVTIFVDMDLEDQALLFATINLKQTKVTKSLAYDLFEYAESRSPQKTGHNIAKLFNSREGSPFFRRIKILGKATGRGFEPLTQATFVDRLLRMVTADAMKDRDLIKRGKKLPMPSSKEKRRFVFRERFVLDQDAEIARIVWNYFEAVANRWTTAWHSDARGNILPRTTGFGALMRVLPLVLLKLDALDRIPATEEFLRVFREIV